MLMAPGGTTLLIIGGDEPAVAAVGVAGLLADIAAASIR